MVLHARYRISPTAMTNCGRFPAASPVAGRSPPALTQAFSLNCLGNSAMIIPVLGLLYRTENEKKKER